ncbi:hypothetical protein AFNJKBDN_CDS0034 [Halorubrum virus V_ICIS4]|nr:hypothetical protein AFNJKBDN_CDS0034 [Halorubrum virus V_ICIS4]
MSAQHAPPERWVDDRDLGDATDHDPHGIVPDGFCDDWNADSIPAALRKAEAAPSSTATYDRYQCPDCESVQVAAKSEKWASEQRAAGAYKCLDCGSHFAEPLTPDFEQATFRDVKRDAAGRDPESLGVERPAAPSIPDERCARWRRAVRGEPNAGDVIDGSPRHSTRRWHLTGRCDCDHDEPALTFARNGQTGVWEVRDA